MCVHRADRDDQPMTNTASFRRGAAALGLVTTAMLMIVSTVLAPEFPNGFDARLAAVEDAGTGGAVSAFAFTLAQLPFIAAVLGIGHLIRSSAPRLSNLGTTLALVGAFGHAVYGGVSMTMLHMADDRPNRAVHVATLESLESGPTVAFMVMGLLGTVLGLLLLAVGLWRARVSARWVAPALGAFLVIEFAGGAVSAWSSHLSALIYTAAFLSLAATVRRSPEDSWSIGASGNSADIRATPAS